jgi:hypothetical protein
MGHLKILLKMKGKKGRKGMVKTLALILSTETLKRSSLE